VVKIDIKDRKILYQLDLNARQSLSKIGKIVFLPKNVISYRIGKLKEKGIIKKFYTHIDAYKLGYISFRFYITYQYTTPEIEDEILTYFVNNRNIWRVISIKGRYDLGVTIWVKDTNSFYSFWKKTMDKYGDYFTNRSFSACIHSLDYRHSYLLANEYKKSDRGLFEITGGGKIIETDDINKKIMDIIADNARKPLNEIAKQLSVSPTMISYRIKELQKLGIIQGFRTDIDISRLGYRHIKVDIYLREHKIRYKIIDYIKFNPNLVHIGTSSGESDVELEFHIEHMNQIYEIMDDLVVKFPNAIRNYKHFIIQKVHKIRYIPEI
jgi:DNA-binding Lrp family transcriptional regulator